MYLEPSEVVFLLHAAKLFDISDGLLAHEIFNPGVHAVDAYHEPRRLSAKVFGARDEGRIQWCALQSLVDTRYRIGLGPRMVLESCSNILTSLVSMLSRV